MLVDEGYTFHLSPDEKFVIGSDPKADIVVQNNISIGRKHALLEFQKGSLFITGFGQNCLFLNGFALHNLQRTQLQENDLIKLSESGPELLVEEIALEKKEANERKRKQRAKIRRGFYLLFLLVSFVTFVILYMDASFNLRLLELASGKNFSLSDFPLFNLWGNKGSREAAPDEEPLFTPVADQTIVTLLDTQLKTIGSAGGGSGQAAGIPSENLALGRINSQLQEQVLEQAARFASAVFLLISADAANRIRAIGTAYAVRENGYVCTAAELIKGAERLYLRNKEYYFLARPAYTDHEEGLAVLQAPLTTKPFTMRILNNKDIGIDVYALDFSAVTAAYIQPALTEEDGVQLGAQLPEKKQIKLKKGMLSRLVQDSTCLVTDIPFAKGEPGGLVVDTNNAVIGLFVPAVPGNIKSEDGKPVIRHIKTIADFKF